MSGVNIPANYEQINLYNSSFSPSTIHCKDTKLQAYYRKYLLQKIMAVYKWGGIPETWDQDYFLYSMFGYGYVAVFDTDEFGVIPQWGALGGYNVFYHPTYVLIANPLLPAMTKYIDQDCTIIKIQPDYSSMMDIVNYYADLMALCSQSMSINLLNTHTATIFPASNKAQAESYKKMFDRVASGEPAVVMDKNLFDESGNPVWMPFSQNIHNTYISDKLLENMRVIENRFDSEIGIPNSNTEKRERLIVDEVNSNNSETVLRPLMWLDEMRDGIRKTNDMFGLNISVDWRINPINNGGETNGDSVNSGIV